MKDLFNLLLGFLTIHSKCPQNCGRIQKKVSNSLGRLLYESDEYSRYAARAATFQIRGWNVQGAAQAVEHGTDR